MFYTKEEIVLFGDHICYRDTVILSVSTFAGLLCTIVTGSGFEIQDGVHLCPKYRQFESKGKLIFARSNSVTRLVNEKRK